MSQQEEARAREILARLHELRAEEDMLKDELFALTERAKKK